MTTESLLLDRDAVHAAFGEWTAAEDSLDAQLDESLAALTAYQSHLDEWQRQLAQEREDLRQAREQFELDRATAENDATNPTAALVAELVEIRETNSVLSSALLTRTEELRSLDERRAELATELESVSVREKELKAALDEHMQTWDQERAKLADEIRDVRAQLASREETVQPAEQNSVPAKKVVDPPQAAAVTKPEAAGSSAVLGSIVEQFGKLRLQRANDRQGGKKTR